MSVIVKDLIKNYYQVDSSTQFDLDCAIVNMSRDNLLDANERIVVKLIMEGNSSTDIAKVIGVSTRHVDRILNSASDKISSHLGEGYSDEKIIDQVEQKLGRPLTETEIAFCWFMIRLYGRGINKDLTIFNFRIARNGKFVTRDENQTKG